MAIPTSRPHDVTVALGSTLREIRRPRGRGLVRPAVQGLVTGALLGVAVGSQALPAVVGVFALGSLAVVYALVSFHIEEP
jgi:hypothetical protein